MIGWACLPTAVTVDYKSLGYPKIFSWLLRQFLCFHKFGCRHGKRNLTRLSYAYSFARGIVQFLFSSDAYQSDIFADTRHSIHESYLIGILTYRRNFTQQNLNKIYFSKSPRSKFRGNKFGGKTMSSLLIKNASAIVTCDKNDAVLEDSHILIEDGVITYMGCEPKSADETIDAAGCIVYPGLINTHHHLYQIGRASCRERV